MKQPKLSHIKVDVKGTEQMRARAHKSKKTKITVNIDQDILAALKKRSDTSGVPYQSLLNRMLRTALNDTRPDDTNIRLDQLDRLDRLERELATIKKRVIAS